MGRFLNVSVKFALYNTATQLNFYKKPTLRWIQHRCLGYTVKPETSLSAAGYDGIVFVSNKEAGSQHHPEPIRGALSRAAQIDAAIDKEGGVLEVNLPASRMVYAPTGPMTDYHDVRTFGEAANKGIARALKAQFKTPLLVLNPDDNFPNCDLVTVLGALEALYVNIQYREDCPDKCPKVKTLGVWSSNHCKLEEAVKLAVALEEARIVARDIGDADPERMSPKRVEEYVCSVFRNNSNVNVSVVSDEQSLHKDYPLFSAVNRGASVIDRHKGRIIYLTYEPAETVTQTLLLVGKGVTYDTGGADIKANGAMSGMSRDKCGAAAVAGFLKLVSLLKPKHLKVIGGMSMVRNSVGENCYVSDEVIMSRSKQRVRVGNTDAEGRMVMADVLCYMKEQVLNGQANVNPHLMTIATLTGHAVLAVGAGYTIAMDNGPARKDDEARKLHLCGETIGDPVVESIIRKEDFEFHKGKGDGDGIFQANNEPSSRTQRGHQGPAAFLIMASGLDKYGLNSSTKIKYTHLDIAASSGHLPHPATGSPILALAKRYLPEFQQ